MEILIRHSKDEKQFAHNLTQDLEGMKSDFGWKVKWSFSYEEL